MTDNFDATNMTLAPGVIDTIISIAVGEVEGVASVGSPTSANSIWARLNSKPSSDGIKTEFTNTGELKVTVHIEVYHGYVLPDLAAQVRSYVSDALRVQLGIPVASVEIYIDAIRFLQQQS